jgi:hypothetical protein
MQTKIFWASRRNALHRFAVIAGSAVLLGSCDAGAQTPKPKPGLQKRSKEKIGYRDQPYEGRTCGKCVLYAGDGECIIVEGKVSKDGWCPQWTPATMGRRAGFPSA